MKFPSENREYVIEAQLSNPTRVHIEGTDLKWDDEDSRLCPFVELGRLRNPHCRAGRPDNQTNRYFFGHRRPEPVYRQDYYVAVYQGAPMGAPERSRIAMTVPEEQTYTEGSVAKGALPLIGRWLEDDAQVMFKPVAGVFPHSALCGRGEGVVIEQVELTSPVRNMTGKVALNTLDLPEKLQRSRSLGRAGRYACRCGRGGQQTRGAEGRNASGYPGGDGCGALHGGRCGRLPRDGFTLKITDAEGSTMTVKKPASETELALRPGQMQAFEPLLYKAARTGAHARRGSRRPGQDRRDAGRSGSGGGCHDLLHRFTVRQATAGSPVNETAEEVTLAADAPILLHERMADVAHYLSQGDKCRLELIAARKDRFGLHPSVRIHLLYAESRNGRGYDSDFRNLYEYEAYDHGGEPRGVYLGRITRPGCWWTNRTTGRARMPRDSCRQRTTRRPVRSP